MEAINIIDPKTGQAHAIPYDQLPNALQAGGQFADEDQKQKAINIQRGNSGESSIAPTPFNGRASETEIRDENIRNTTGFKGLAGETLLNLSNAMKSGVLFGRDLPKMAKEATKAEEERPFRPYIATGGALADIAKSTINAPHDLAKFVARKEILPESLNKVYEEASNYLPHVPEDTGVASIFGLDKEQPEDRLYKGLAGALAMGAPSALGKLKGLEAGIKPQRIMPKHLEKEINREKNILDISGKRLAKFKEALESNPEYRSGKPSTLKRTAGDLEAKIEELHPLTQIPEKQVPEISPEPNTGKMMRMAKADTKQASELLSKGLGEGRRLHVEGGEIFGKEIEDIRKSASKKFEDTKDYFNQYDIKIDKSEAITGLKDKIEGLKAHYKDIPGYETDTPDVKSLEKQLNALEKPEYVKASDVLTMYRTLDKLEKDTHNKIYERGSKLNEQEKTQLSSLASKYRGLTEELGDVLDNVGDKKGLKMVQEAKSDWKEYASIYGNPTAQYMERHKALHPSTMANLELGTRGNELLNKIVDKNPQLRQAIFGQKFANPASHKQLLRPNDVHDMYLNKLSEGLPDNQIQKMVEAFRNAAETESEVKASAADLKAEHKELASSIEEEAKNQKLRQDAIANVNKYQELIGKKNKAADLVKKKINHNIARGENINALEAQLNELESNSAKLKKLLKGAIKIAYRYGGIKSAMKH